MFCSLELVGDTPQAVRCNTNEIILQINALLMGTGRQSASLQFDATVTRNKQSRRLMFCPSELTVDIPFDDVTRQK